MSLRQFIQEHRSLSEVADIHAAVDPDTHLSAQIYAQMQKSSPSIMWFRNLEENPYSVVANLFATRERLNRVLSCADKSLAQRLEHLPASIKSWTDFSVYIRQEFTWISTFQSEHEAPVSEIDSLYALPLVHYWSGDTRAYFSLPTVFTRDFYSGEINAGIYRLSPIDSKTLTLNWRRGSRAYNAWRVYADRGEKMPVSVAMGVDPALTFASMFPLPGVGAELALWGFIRGYAQELRCNSEGLPSPADAEIVLEGYVDPCQYHDEGSFANHTGFYTESVPCPVMHVNTIRARTDAIMPITLVGPPPTENTLLGATIWQLLFVYIRRELPYLLNLACPAETAYLPVLIVQVQAPESVAAWKERKHIIVQHSILKRAHTLILVEENTSVSSSKLIFWHCMNLGIENYVVTDSGMRLVDGVMWRYQGERRVESEDLTAKNDVL